MTLHGKLLSYTVAGSLITDCNQQYSALRMTSGVQTVTVSHMKMLNLPLCWYMVCHAVWNYIMKCKVCFAACAVGKSVQLSEQLACHSQKSGADDENMLWKRLLLSSTSKSHSVIWSIWTFLNEPFKTYSAEISTSERDAFFKALWVNGGNAFC